MNVVISDTHARTGHALTGQLLADVRSASTVLHAGDFTTPAVYDAIAAESDELLAVAGNSDRLDLRQQLPAHRTVVIGNVRVLLVHGHAHTAQSLSLFAREQSADFVVRGHTHSPTIDTPGAVPVVNPGSYAEPRGNRPAYGRFTVTEGSIEIALCALDGTPFDRLTIDTSPTG